MTDDTNIWVHFAAEQPSKRKRAELVCVFCHSKKIKCDLQIISSQGGDRCTNCDEADHECEVRPSKRGKSRRTTGNTVVSRPESAPAITDQGPLSTSVDQTQIILPDICVDDPGYQEFGEHRDEVVFEAPNISTQPSLVPSQGIIQSHSGDVDTGYLQVYAAENQLSAGLQGQMIHTTPSVNPTDSGKEELQQGFAETYFDYCYTWCPILDAETISSEMARSSILADAVALAASHVQPPLVPHEGPATYYERARNAFYNDEEIDGLTTLKALLLFYWWAPRPPSTAHRHSSWWWTSVVIRHAQQMNIHREPTGHSHDSPMMSLRRKIWWTAYARERLTALCQSKPCIINEKDCTIGEVRLSDFPSDADSQRKGLIFIHWIRLCAIIGRVAKSLLRSDEDDRLGILRQEMVEWITSLPAELRLQIGSARTLTFDRDVHQLHLPYLTTTIILHLKRSPHDLPQALPPAILAASCVARVMRDILTRGNARFLMAISCWHTGVAMIPLLQATRIHQFRTEAKAGIDTLISTIQQLQKMWGSATIIQQGFDRLLKDTLPKNGSLDAERRQDMIRFNETHLASLDDFDWTLLFPFVTKSTNTIAASLLEDKAQGTITRGFPSPSDMLFYERLLDQYNGFIEPMTEYDFDFTNFPA